MMNGSQKSLSLRLRSGQAPKSQREIFLGWGTHSGVSFSRIGLTRCSDAGFARGTDEGVRPYTGVSLTGFGLQFLQPGGWVGSSKGRALS
jgi:hypothetical protein